MLGRDLRLPIDLHIGCPEDEAVFSTTTLAEELEKRLEHVHEFACTNLKVVNDRMKERYDSMAEATLLERAESV